MKFDIKGAAKAFGNFVKVNKEPIVGGGSALLMIAGTILTGIATVKATKKIERINEERDEPLTKKEVVKEVYKDYIPAVAATVIGATGSVWSNVKLVKKCASLSTAYAIADAALMEYKDAAKEVLTEKQENEVHRKAVEKRMEKADASKAECTKFGNTLCFDQASGRYFYSDIDAIKNAINEFNSIALSNGKSNDEATTLNELYYLLNLSPCLIGERFGWIVQKPEDFIRLREGSINEEGTGRPCYTIDFWEQPSYIDDYGNIRKD